MIPEGAAFCNTGLSYNGAFCYDQFRYIQFHTNAEYYAQFCYTHSYTRADCYARFRNSANVCTISLDSVQVYGILLVWWFP